MQRMQIGAKDIIYIICVMIATNKNSVKHVMQSDMGIWSPICKSHCTEVQ